LTTATQHILTRSQAVAGIADSTASQHAGYLGISDCG